MGEIDTDTQTRKLRQLREHIEQQSRSGLLEWDERQRWRRVLQMLKEAMDDRP